MYLQLKGQRGILMSQDLSKINLNEVFKRKKNDQEIFSELMAFKVNEVLLVATHYDAYAIVREGRFFDKIFGEYLQLNLLTAPRVTSVSTKEEAVSANKSTHFSMAILMVGLDKKQPLELANELKRDKPELPILMMVNNSADLKFFDDATSNINLIERIFVWNGDSRVFLAMIKYVEDKMNVENDVAVGDVRIILLVEDSHKYYTHYLPLLYSIVMNQTQAILEEESTERLHKILKMRVRPKIILASDYNEAQAIIDRYYDNIICVISDVEFKRNGIFNENAGVELINYVKSRISIPTLLQSGKVENREKAKALGSDFIYKHSETLIQEIKDFIYNKLGFGDFVFKNSREMVIATAHNLHEFKECIANVPLESLLFHAGRNGISTWLMARGEIVTAKRLRQFRVEDFDSSAKLKSTILQVFEDVRLDRLKGGVVLFDETSVTNNRYISRIGEGSFGGKGRGMAFISHFIENIDFEKLIPELQIRIPPTSVIGATEYTKFIEYNNISHQVYSNIPYEQVKELFLNGSFPFEIEQQLRVYVTNMRGPIAVRSSGLFEDSLLQPFAGVYATYIIPNNNPSLEFNLRQLTDAIKLVYSSIFTTTAKSYFEAVDYRVEDEKMAVILQQLVGQKSRDYFYPHISGVAQSNNYYPFSYMQPEDGFAVLAVGLGKYVVGGEKAWRFCPKYPTLELNSIADQIRDSQSYFYALDLSQDVQNIIEAGEDAGICKLDIKEAEEDGNLTHCAEVYDREYERMGSDFTLRGSRVVNFANILKYESIPLAQTLNLLLRFFNEALGSPVEIEFAVDLESEPNPTLYLLQIKPLIRLESHAEIEFDSLDNSKIILQSAKGMGNGKLEHITDIIYLKTETFDRTKTELMAQEIEYLNRMMIEQKREYLLIGVGRWGTRDRFTGIPVYWSQISHAKVIVEIGLPDFPLEASLGSHFFHNVTSMNVGYFSIPNNNQQSWINFDYLNKMPSVTETTYFRHIQLPKPVTILMNGRQQKGVVLLQDDDS